MILVLGDQFIDRYHIGRVRGLSAEAPIPVVDVISTFDLPGGVGNVVQNLKALGNRCYPIFPRGANGVKNRLLVENTHQQLARWDERDWCESYDVDFVTETISWSKIDLVVVADYGKGSIHEKLIETILSWNLPTLVDTKSNPSSWLPGGERVILFPNKKEFNQYRDLYEWFPHVLLKSGPSGLYWMEYGRIILTHPALAERVVSVNGAGDTIIAACAIALTEGMGQVDMLEFASCAAACAVEMPYTSAPCREVVNDRLRQLNESRVKSGIL